MSDQTIWRTRMGADVYQIFIECPDGTIETLNVISNDDINHVKTQIQTITNNKYPVNKQKLFLQGNELDNNKTLMDNNIVRFYTLQLCASKIAIFIETQHGKIIHLMAEPDELLFNVKKRIQDRTDGQYLINDQQLTNRLNKQELIDDNKSIFLDYGLIENSLLYLANNIDIELKENAESNLPTFTNSTLDHKIVENTDCFLTANDDKIKTLNQEMHSINSSLASLNEKKKLKSKKKIKHKRKKSPRNKKRKAPKMLKENLKQFNNVDYNDLFGDIINDSITTNTETHDKMDEFGDLLIRKRTKSAHVKHKKKSKHVESVSMMSYDELFGDSNEFMIGKITTPKFNKRKFFADSPKKSAGRVGLGAHNASGMDMDINAVFDMTEIDSIVNNLGTYQKNYIDSTNVTNAVPNTMINAVPNMTNAVQSNNTNYIENSTTNVVQNNTINAVPNMTNAVQNNLNGKRRKNVKRKKVVQQRVAEDSLFDSSDENDGWNEKYAVRKKRKKNLNVESEKKRRKKIKTSTSTKWIVYELQKQDEYGMIWDRVPKMKNGKVNGSRMKMLMEQSGLSQEMLKKIWNLSDLDKDGRMGKEEFSLCMFLIDMAVNGEKLPLKLPENYIPPSFRIQGKRFRKSPKRKTKTLTRVRAMSMKNPKEYQRAIAKNQNIMHTAGNSYRPRHGYNSANKVKSIKMFQVDASITTKQVKTVKKPEKVVQNSLRSKPEQVKVFKNMSLQESKTDTLNGNAAFGMNEIDLIVNDLDKYENYLNENINNGLKIHKHEDRQEFESYNVSNVSPMQSSNKQTEKEELKNDNKKKKMGGKRMSQILREIEFDEVDLHNDEKLKFENSRKQDFNDLMDGFFSDDDEDDEQDNDHTLVDESIESQQKINKQQMTLKELLKKFGLRTTGELYKYYNRTLQIEYAKDLVNFLPKQITQPPQFKSTKIRMLLTRMSKYVMNKVIINEWNGIHETEWKELSTNRLSHIFGTSPMLKKLKALNKSNYIQCKNNDLCFEDNKESNRIRLIGECLTFIDKKILSFTSTAINITFEDIPDTDSGYHQQDVVIIGISFYDCNDILYDTVYISDRCEIHRNDTFLTMLSLSNFMMIENNSEIIVDINSRKPKETIIKFSHLKNGILYKHNEREISFDVNNINKGYIKIYIRQFYGEGTYSIYQMLKKTDKNNDGDSTKIDNKNYETNGSSFKKYVKYRHKSNQIDRNRKHRKSI